ncbi:MAG: hypothetical protein ATN35_01965 [Epulopiscium sp. Nele67-Bin004]|nr:MAG: hypothetical protein ATN35_01965 [Epulopiscium sp. Nele67-Bin004]
MKTILITGVAGFIGFHLSKYLLKQGCKVIGIDNINDYYDIKIKEARLNMLFDYANFVFYKQDIKYAYKLNSVFEKHRPEYVINLAAQAGVRYSLVNPTAYIDCNVMGFMNILEACKSYNIKHFLFASSSSVYGANKTVPFSIDHKTDQPISLYAATKKSNELMAHAYSHLFDIPMTGLRFFTVYGEWGRPDMAYYLFTENILNEKPIKVFNNGQMKRDFTYIGDLIDYIYKLLDKPPINLEMNTKEEQTMSNAKYRVLNVGGQTSILLEEFISVIEDATNKKAIKHYLPIQKGDVEETFADISELEKLVGKVSYTSIDIGIEKFVEWYKDFNEEM